MSSQVTKQDEDWSRIERIRQGDRSAFDGLFRKHLGAVVNLAYRFLRDRQTAEDVAQDVFLKVYEGKARVLPQAKFTTWLYRVTVNASIDAVRRRKRSPRSLDEQVPDEEGESRSLLDRVPDRRATSPGEAADQEELRALVDRHIQRLPEKFRAPLVLHQFQELPYAEIAAILGVSEKAVERRLFHAREILRKRLAGYL